MGFLDHSTNNIIVDAVLTDLGRQALSSNDGSFAIAKFALGDDEVDYGLITKFGRTVGKEKIIKNTPVFEAQTVGTLALTNKLISLADQGLTRVPIISMTGTGLNTDGSVPVLSVIKGNSRQITLEQIIQNETTIPVQLRDRSFFVQADSRFLTINNSPYTFIDQNNIGQLTAVANQSSNSQGGSVIQLTITAKQISDSFFTIFGQVTDKTTIVTTLKIIGLQSAQVTEVQVQISKS